MRKALAFPFSQVLAVFCPGSTFPESYLLLAVAWLCNVGRARSRHVVDCECVWFPGGLGQGGSASWVHPKATGLKLSLPQSLIYKIVLLSFSSGMEVGVIRLNIGHWPIVFMLLPWILSLNNLTEWEFYFGGKWRCPSSFCSSYLFALISYCRNFPH